jgi:hypothetical protein
VTPLLKRRCDCRNAVTLADRGGEHVGVEEADGLRLLSWSVLEAQVAWVFGRAGATRAAAVLAGSQTGPRGRP